MSEGPNAFVRLGENGRIYYIGFNETTLRSCRVDGSDVRDELTLIPSDSYGTGGYFFGFGTMPDDQHFAWSYGRTGPITAYDLTAPTTPVVIAGGSAGVSWAL